jgi:hypothetical protein
MGLHRTHRKKKDRQEAAEQKIKNRVFKVRERIRRDKRMISEIKAGGLPYTPTVMSWLSRKLEKPAGKITQQDVKALLA